MNPRGRLLFEAVGEIDGKYVLAAAEALEDSGKIVNMHSRKKLWRTLLIAAALSALFVGTAFATGLFGLSSRLAYSVDTGKAYETTNGLAGSPEAQATVEWFEFAEAYRERQTGDWADFSYSFTQGDTELKAICEVYFAHDKTMAGKLLEVADKYSLRLYADRTQADEVSLFYELSGVEPFFPQVETNETGYAYIFPDGSFKLDGRMELAGRRVSYVLHRIYAGALYPYGGEFRREGEYEEWAYTTAQGYDVGLVHYTTADTYYSLALYYNDVANGVYVNMSMDINKTALDDDESLKQAAQAVADELDLSAVCASRGTAVEILSRDRVPAHNAQAVKALEAFENSAVWKANREFQDFFTENFYGVAFTGTYGMEGYEDIDAELARVGEKYGLTYAVGKTVGNSLYPSAAVYDNGAWFASLEEPTAAYQLHYIPKAALYTRLSVFTPMAEYAKVWTYETKSGATVICAMDLDGMTLALYETEDSYVLLHLTRNRDVSEIERAADAVDFARLEEIK